LKRGFKIKFLIKRRVSMKAAKLIALYLTLLIFAPLLRGQEHPGEHPGVEEKIRPNDVRQAIMDYINRDTALKGGYFLIWDDKEGKVWKLRFSKLHDKVRVIEGETYFMCTDFSSEKDTLDIDFWLEEDILGNLKVTKIKIHKVNKKPRFTYEGNKIKELK
jgi:hypothetical protein